MAHTATQTKSVCLPSRKSVCGVFAFSEHTISGPIMLACVEKSVCVRVCCGKHVYKNLCSGKNCDAYVNNVAMLQRCNVCKNWRVKIEPIYAPFWCLDRHIEHKWHWNMIVFIFGYVVHSRSLQLMGCWQLFLLYHFFVERKKCLKRNKWIGCYFSLALQIGRQWNNNNNNNKKKKLAKSLMAFSVHKRCAFSVSAWICSKNSIRHEICFNINQNNATITPEWDKCEWTQMSTR